MSSFGHLTGNSTDFHPEAVNFRSNLTNSTIYTEQIVERILMIYVLPVIILIGTVGNLMSFIVLVGSHHMRNTSVYFYMAVLALADTTVLFVSGFKTWIRLVADFELLHVSDFVCKMTYFVLLFSLHFSSWLVVLTTADRFVAVWFPLRAIFWCRFFRALLVVLFLALILIAYNIHVFWTMSLQHGLSKPFPSTMCWALVGNSFMKNHFEYLKLFSYSILPFVIILVLNILIIVRLKVKTPFRGRQMQGSTVSSGWESTVGRQARVTYMLLSVSFAYLIFTAPFMVFLLFVNPTDDKKLRAQLMLVKTVCFMLMYTNHAVNFFLYCVTGKKFRLALADLYGSCCRRSKDVQPKTRSSSLYSPSIRIPKSSAVEMEVREYCLPIAVNDDDIKF